MKYPDILKALQKGEKDRVPIGPVSEMVPGGLTLDEAKSIAEEGIRLRIEKSERMMGYKVGFTNIPIRKKMGLPGSTYGFILDTMVLESGDVCHMNELIAPKIETEICFKLKEDLSGSNLSIEKVMKATEGVKPAMEICDARIKDWKAPYPDFFADNGFSARIVLGHDDWVDARSINLKEVTVMLYKGEEKIAEGKGENALDHPANAVIWLAEELAKRGKQIKADQFVMTGTLTPILPINRGDYFKAEFSTLGQVEVTFI